MVPEPSHAKTHQTVQGLAADLRDPLVEAEAAIDWLERDAVARPGEYEPVLARITALRMRLLNLHDHVNRTVADARMDAIDRLAAQMRGVTNEQRSAA